MSKFDNDDDDDNLVNGHKSIINFSRFCSRFVSRDFASINDRGKKTRISSETTLKHQQQSKVNCQQSKVNGQRS